MWIYVIGAAAIIGATIVGVLLALWIDRREGKKLARMLGDRPL